MAQQRSEWAEKIRQLRGNRSQRAFATAVGGEVTPSLISSWEAGRYEPSAERYVLLGNMAPYPDCYWFWGRGKVNRAAQLAAAEKVLSESIAEVSSDEVIRIPIQEHAPAHGDSPIPRAGEQHLLISRGLVAHPSATFGVRVDTQQLKPFLLPGDILLIDSSEREVDRLVDRPERLVFASEGPAGKHAREFLASEGESAEWEHPRFEIGWLRTLKGLDGNFNIYLDAPQDMDESINAGALIAQYSSKTKTMEFNEAFVIAGFIVAHFRCGAADANVVAKRTARAGGSLRKSRGQRGVKKSGS